MEGAWPLLAPLEPPLLTCIRKRREDRVTAQTRPYCVDSNQRLSQNFFSRRSKICGLGGSPLVGCMSKDACPESCTIHVEFLSTI